MDGKRQKTSEEAELFRGVMSLLLTPFDADKGIDWYTYDAYVDWQLSQKPHGLFAVCGSSEMKWLNLQERLALAERAVLRAKDVPVLAVANLHPDPERHREELDRMVATGVSGVVLVPYDGLALDVVKLEEYFTALALIEASPVPVFLYELPQVEPHLLPVEVFTRLVARGAVGIKDTTCTMEGITAKINSAPKAIVYQANTPFARDAIAAGAGGIMTITSTCYTDLVVRFWWAVTQKDEIAAVLHRELVFLDSLLIRGHPQAAKYVVHLRGMEFPLYTRWPVKLEPQVLRALDAWYTCSRI